MIIMKKSRIIFVCMFFICFLKLTNAQVLDIDGTRKTLSTKSSDFAPFPGKWLAEHGNEIIEIELKLKVGLVDKDAIVRADNKRVNYRILLSYKVFDRNTHQLIASDVLGEIIYDKYSLWPTVSMNMNILADPTFYPLKLIKPDNLAYSYSFQFMDYKKCFTNIAVKLTILPAKQNELIWISEVMNEVNQVYDMEDDLNCYVIKDNSLMTIPSRLTFKRFQEK